MAALVRAKRYPQRARLRGSEGKLAVTFTFRRDGTLVGWRLASSSGDPDLDQAAGEMIERAAPLPPMPASYPGESATMTVPVDFSLR
jgi:protein TonB